MIEIVRKGAFDSFALETACSLLERAQNHEAAIAGITFNTHGLTSLMLEEDLVNGDGLLLLAFDGHEPVGTLTIVNDMRENWYRRHEVKPRLIKYVAVLPEQQGRGIASHLVQEAIELTDELVSVSTDSLNRHAVHLYEKSGFICMEFNRGKGAAGNSVRLAHWRNGCPWPAFVIYGKVFLSRVRCLIKALIRY